MLTLGERIRYLRTTLLRENQAAFAEKLGFARVATISDYEKNKRTPDVETLRKIATIGSVTIEWLLTGQGSVSGFTERENPSILDRGSLEPPAGFVEVKVFDIHAAADPSRFPGSVPSGTYLVPAQGHSKSTVAVRVKGDSMSPCLMDGAVVGIDRGDRRLVSGGLYAVWLDYEGTTIKRVFVFPDRVVLRPDNQSFPETAIPSERLREERILGRVVWMFQRF